MDDDLFPELFNLNSEAPETVYGGETVGSSQKILHGRRYLRQGAEHDGPVGNGFISGDGDFSPYILDTRLFHKCSPLFTLALSRAAAAVI